MIVQSLVLVARQQNGGKLLLNFNVRVQVYGTVILRERLLVHGLEEGIEAVAFEIFGLAVEAAILCLVVILVELGCQGLRLDDYATLRLKQSCPEV